MILFAQKNLKCMKISPVNTVAITLNHVHTVKPLNNGHFGTSQL